MSNFLGAYQVIRMAKNKKSKILASILAVSTMAVFYAAPVMAGSVNSIEGDSSGIHFDFGYKKDSNTSISDGEINGSDGIYVAGPAGNEIGGITHTIVGKFTITSDAVINALEGKTFNDLTINNLDTTNLTVNGKTVDLSQLENVKGITRSAGATTPGTGTTTIEGVLSVDGNTGEIYQEDGAFSVDEDGDLIAKSVTDGVYDLATIGKNTQKIKFDGENTVVAGKLVADKFGTTNNSFWVTKDGAISAANNKFSVGASGEVKAANGNFEIKNNGNVTATAVKVGEYDLETIGKNTQKVTFNGKETVVAGKLVADKFGTSNDAFYVDENGTIKGNSLIIGKNGDNAVFKVDRNGNTEIKGNVTMAKDATVDGVDVSELGGNVAGISRNNGDLPYGQGVTSIEGVVSVDGQSGFVNFSTGNGNGVLINSSQGQIIANQVVASSVGANNVATENLTAGNGALRVSENGDILMQNGSGESISMTDGGLNLMSTDNGTGMVTLRDGSVSLMGNGTSTVTVDENGTTFGTVLGSETTNINGGTVTASEDVVADGVSLKNLAGKFDATNANVAGIRRDAAEGAAYGEGTTTIEDTLSVSGDSVLAQVGSSQLVITEDVAGLSSGNASFALSNNELQLSVAGNGLLVNQFGTNLNGTVNFIGHDGNSYTLSDLEGRVYDLEQKTQNITSAEPGQGGSSEVPPTGDGHTGFEGNVTVGGAINADKGNFNKVNTDEITVGDNTFIDGDSVNSNEGNFKDKVTVGSGENQTVINNGGITVGDSEGTSINHDEVRVGGEGGSYMNENDVVTGEGNSLNDTANRVGNLEQGVSELNNRVGELEDRIDKVGAMAAAIANLRTMGYDPAAPTEVAVGIGQYRDETGAALGLFHYPNRDFMLSLSVSTSGDEVMGGIGATWKFGRKSPEKVAEIKKAQAEADARRAEEAKLAKAEEMKQAAKEAKIKAQQERHAKLAAERAAQAEAAK